MVLVTSVVESKGKTVKRTYKIDIVIWIVSQILMWGFIAFLHYVDSPKDSPGIHEVVSYAYFLGITFLYTWLLWITLKRGV